MGTSRRRSIHHGDARSCRCCISQIPAGRHHAVSGRERRGHQEPVGRGGARDVKRDYRAFLRWGALSRVRSMVSSVSASGMARHLGVMAAPSPSRSSHCSRSSHGPHQPPRPKPIHVHSLPPRLGVGCRTARLLPGSALFLAFLHHGLRSCICHLCRFAWIMPSCASLRSVSSSGINSGQRSHRKSIQQCGRPI